MLISNKTVKNRGLFCEIKTGEGKSIIISMFAIYLVLAGNDVDIITSNTDLAKRDSEKM